MTIEQGKLAALRQQYLERDDTSDPNGRIYRDKITGEIYHSCTRILSATMPESNKKALERWLERPNSIQTRDMAAARGTAMHNSAEYILKVAQRLARSTANKRGVWRVGEDGLFRAPEKIVKWSLEKAVQGAPRVPWSAAGYARGLRGWILDHVVNIHAIEFFGHHPCGAAGACDALLDLKIDGETIGPVIVDWKSTGKSIHGSMDAAMANYTDQTGGYGLMLRHRTGIQASGGAVVVCRRSGAPQVTLLSQDELLAAQERFLGRCADYYSNLPIPGASE